MLAKLGDKPRDVLAAKVAISTATSAKLTNYRARWNSLANSHTSKNDVTDNFNFALETNINHLL